MNFPLQVEAIAGLFALLFLYKLWMASRASEHNKKINKVPEPGRALPIIGHLHLLRGPEPIHEKFGSMADKYGPVFMVRLGFQQTLVVSSWEVAKECFTTNDKALASRPPSAMTKYMGYRNAMFAFMPYGPYWREMRKITTLHLLSNSRLEILKHVWVEEVGTRMKELYVMWMNNDCRPIKIDMIEWLGSLTFKVIVTMVAGKQIFSNSEEAERFRVEIRQFLALATSSVLTDMFPFLEWVDWKGHLSAIRRNHKELDSFMTKLVEEHYQKNNRSEGRGEGDKDFMDLMISILEDTEFAGHDSNTIIKAASLSLILGGTETTAVAMSAVISLVMNNRHVLKKTQDELDFHISKHRQVDESDINNLKYLRAVIKEMLRMAPAARFTVKHEAMEDIRVTGISVPAGTQVLVNLWKLQQDPRIWSDPLEFQPERFLTSHVDVDARGQHFEYIPFGSGRRACPGISFSLQLMQFTLASLFYSFELESPSGAPLKFNGGINQDKCMEVLLTPRLPVELYE